MSLSGLCQLCGDREASNACPMCGTLVCKEHYDEAHGVCQRCAVGRSTNVGVE